MPVNTLDNSIRTVTMILFIDLETYSTDQLMELCYAQFFKPIQVSLCGAADTSLRKKILTEKSVKRRIKFKNLRYIASFLKKE